MSLRKAYLYLVSVISLVIWVIGGIQLLDMGLKATIFQKADRDYYMGECYSSKAPVDGRPVECSAEEEEKFRLRKEENRSAQKQRQASTALSMIIIAAPVWWFHWRLAKREQ
jgi:hypothetical protein